MTATTKAPKRCQWCSGDGQMQEYHDQEWGVPQLNDNAQFEHMLLEIFQAGLSWSIVLRKRENFRKAFAGFDPKKVAKFNEAKFETLLLDAGIIRNRAKILAAIHNAPLFMEISKVFGSFAKFIWEYQPRKGHRYNTMADIPAQTDESVKLGKELKRRGFKFLGPTTIYAHMQAVGIVNDHEVGCFRYKEIENLRKVVNASLK
ncbi:DNA-3-methyladenine glycosylase I [Calditrichota bacterium]